MLILKSLSAWLLAAVILTNTSPLALQKAVTNGQSSATPVWSESLSRQPSTYNGGLFKTITTVQEYFNKLNLIPGASLGGGLQLMYKIQ
ncbi:hypothetical protein SDC9_190677 [bioreactor metagenome]|uniref:Uncharacterized protein n=1 Tax=bioreactor metagenome TaxID=1076179 RepID=A0A645HVS2_9ZZZZ